MGSEIKAVVQVVQHDDGTVDVNVTHMSDDPWVREVAEATKQIWEEVLTHIKKET